jgi:excisionase family DNA binding protein
MNPAIPKPLRTHDLIPTPAGAIPRLLSIADVAEWLGVSKSWVYDHITRKQPRLPCIRLGEITRFRVEEIEEFIREHASGSQ